MSSSTSLHDQPLFTLDPVAAIEENGGTALDALGLQLRLSALRRQACVDSADTCFGDGLDRYLWVARDCGFTPLAERPFVDTSHVGTPRDERLIIMVHAPTGILLSIETYCGTSVNRAMLYFVVKNRPQGARWSGGAESLTHPGWRVDPQFFQDGKVSFPADLLHVANCDVRECLRSHFQQVLASEPVSRPVADRFECVEAFGHRQDYTELTDPKTRRVLFQAVSPYRRQKLRSFCLANPEVNIGLFGLD